MLFLGAALMLSGLVFMPHAQHVFWAPEAFAARVLAPLPLLALLFDARPSQALDAGMGSGLLWLLIGAWFLSAGLAFRQDLAMRELSAWLSAPLIFASSWRLSDEAQGRGRIVFYILAAALLQSLYGLAQSAGLEPSLASLFGPRAFGFNELNWAVSFGGRAGAFLGNPNFLGGHLAMLLPLSVALAMDGRGGRLRRLSRWALAALLGAGLVVTQTRGAWLGAAVGLGFFFWVCRSRMRGIVTRNRLALGGLAGAAVLALGLFFATHAQNLSRLSSIFSGDQELMRRFTLMSISLKAAAAHPLLGVGPGNFRIFFPQFQAQGIAQQALLGRPYIVTEHAHNDFIQMAADCGFPALLLLLALLAWAAKALWKGLSLAGQPLRPESEAPEKLFLAGILSGLLALEVHALANFPFLIAPTQMSAWALAAVGLRLALPPAADTAGKRPLLMKAAAWLCALAFALGAFDAGRMLHKDALWWVAEGEQRLGHADRAEHWLFRTLELDRREERLWLLHGKALLDKDFAINATGSFKEAVRLNPHFHEARVMLGRACVGVGKYSDAVEALSVAAMEAPNLTDLWEPLAAAYYMQSQYLEAVTAYDWAAYFNAASAQMLENKAAALGSLGRYREALEALDQAEAREPRRAKNFVNRAITHIKMGARDLARIELQEAARRDPSDTQVKDLMKAVR